MDSEFVALYELAISQGQKHADLIAQIKQAVLAGFRQQYPKSPAAATVLVDETTGQIRIYSGDKDITPTNFASEAASIARQVVINRLSVTTQPKVTPQKPAATPTATHPLSGLLVNLFFWGYNVYFLLFNLLFVSSYLSSGTWENMTRLGLFRLLLSVIVLATPAVSMWWAYKNQLYRRPAALLKLFFLFELPLVVASFIPLTLLASTTPFVVLVTLSLLTIPGILYLYEADTPLSGGFLKVVFFLEQSVLFMWAYLTLLFAFFAPLIVGWAAKMLLSPVFDVFSFRQSYGMYPSPYPEPVIGLFLQVALGFLLLSVVIGLTLVPFLLLLVLGRAFLKSWYLLEADNRHLAAIFAVVILTLSTLVAYQPTNTGLLTKLRQIATVESFAEKEQLAQDLLPQEATLKSYINDLVTGRSRYPFTREDSSLSSGYQNIFVLDQIQAEFIQNVFLTVAYPFVFQGETDPDGTLAKNFQYVFGYSPYETRTPAPIPTPAGTVLLAYRKVSVTPVAGGLLATVTIEEEYDNTTYQEQEVIYEFVLPSDAVMTDLKLGPNLEFPGIIAPKGAAQKTYERELQRRRDPALLEQTGPSQYRLRIYPIPAKGDLATLQGQRQKVQYTYVVSATPDGYPLPEFTRKANIFTNSASQFLSGAPVSLQSFNEMDKFIPLPADTPDVCRDSLSDVTLAEAGLTATISVNGKSDRLKSLACGSDQEVLEILSQTKIAVFFDVSATNKDNQTLALTDLKKLLGSGSNFLTRNSVDFYKYNDGVSQKTTLTGAALDSLSLSYFGPSDIWNALKLFNERYDVVLVVTGAKETFPAYNNVYPFTRSPVFLIHPQAPPPYSLELTSRLLQSRGGGVDSVIAGLRHFALTKEAAEISGATATGSYLNVSFTGKGLTDQVPPPFILEKNALTHYVNKALFNSTVWAQATDVTGDITILDKFHAFDEQAAIVTPFSSLISLVNEEQRQRLEEFKKSYSRYQDQPPVENVVPVPRPFALEERIFSPSLLGPGAGMQLPSIGAPGVIRDGGGELGITGPTGIAATSGLVSGLGLFVLLNVLLLAGGFGFFLLQILRKKRR